MPARTGLHPREWPAADRTAWDAAFAGDDVFDRGAGAHLGPRTRCAGVWLCPLARLAVILAGHASEPVFLNTVSSGADEDIRMATQLARSMVGRWGMSKEVGPVDVRESDEHPFLGRQIAQPRRLSEDGSDACGAARRP